MIKFKPRILPAPEAVALITDEGLQWREAVGTPAVGPLVTEAVRDGRCDVVVVTWHRDNLFGSWGGDRYSVPAIDPEALASLSPPDEFRERFDLVRISDVAESVLVARRSTVFVIEADEEDPPVVAAVFLTSSIGGDIGKLLIEAAQGACSCTSQLRKAHVSGVDLTWRNGATPKLGWQFTAGFHKGTGMRNYRRQLKVHDKHRKELTKEHTKKLNHSMAAAADLLSRIEKIASPAVYTVRSYAAFAGGRPIHAGCIPGTRRDDSPASQFGVSDFGFASWLHEDVHAEGTTETIAWSCPTNGIPNHFLISDINVDLDLTAAEGSCLLLDGSLRHGTVPSLPPDRFDKKDFRHDAPGMVIATRKSIMWERGWNHFRKGD